MVIPVVGPLPPGSRPATEGFPLLLGEADEWPPDVAVLDRRHAEADVLIAQQRGRLVQIEGLPPRDKFVHEFGVDQQPRATPSA